MNKYIVFIFFLTILTTSIGILPKVEKCDKYLNQRARKIARIRNVELDL